MKQRKNKAALAILIAGIVMMIGGVLIVIGACLGEKLTKPLMAAIAMAAIAICEFLYAFLLIRHAVAPGRKEKPGEGEEQKLKRGSVVSVSLSVGISMGVLFSAVFCRVLESAAGICVGICSGIAFGSLTALLFSAGKTKKEKKGDENGGTTETRG